MPGLARFDTAITLRPVASAKPFTAVRPTRTPVNEPGPDADAKASIWSTLKPWRREQTLDLAEQDVREAVRRIERHFFEQRLPADQRDTSELPRGIDRQYVKAHGVSLYTLSSAYAFPLALSSIRRKLTVAGYWLARERGSVSVPSRPVPTTR